ncbi:unspecified toxin/drug abc transporter ATP-binding and permease protein [Mycoplasmopsis columbina SF7]|uniref:Unspecified toxin/drug abc transporter ATP-binding and permease protein n=1 Tax=Mycoplasmopsis columbina SF7 TaxID=1037410 RepID=F9UJ52_9BACT|nr:ATP-binding cassette domain-containing protein [Mycoplasmopsis columbina]EGV00548.1 unspecified toxin/drug abc transporter ATP-binding and permease protein [Mycoplasmopsis columbina SF7]
MKITKQNDIKDCGLHILQFFALYHNDQYIDINYLKLNASYNENGININSLKDQAKKINLELKSYSCDFLTLEKISEKNLPIVLLINKNGLNHFVILEKIKNYKFYIQDSSIGDRTVYKKDELEKIFLNVVLTFDKIENTKNIDIILNNKFSEFSEFKKETFLVFLISILNLFFSFSVSLFFKIVFDFLIPNNLSENLIILSIVFLLLNSFKFINSFLKNIILKKVTMKIENKITTALLNKLSHCDEKTLNKLTTNEYIKKFSYIPFIAEYKANFTHSILFETFSIIGSILILIWLHFWLFSIVFIILFISLLVNFAFHIKIKKTYPLVLNANLEKLIADMNIINSKNNFLNSDSYNFFKKINNEKLFLYQKNNFSFFNSLNSKNYFIDLIMGNLNLIIVFVGGIFIFSNQISFGILMMFISISNFLFMPANSLFSIFLNKSLLNSQQSELNFILNFSEKETNGKFKISKINEIEINNLLFEYEVDKKIVNLKHFLINQNIQINGKNGSGKSSFLNLIAFLNFPTNGSIKINNIEYKNIDIEDLQNNICFIKQNEFLPSTSIYEYVTENNEKKIEFLNNLLNNKQFAEIINLMRINFQSQIIDGGKNFSSGQKQFISLLKLFTKNYKLVILDEAFENISFEIYSKIKALIKEIFVSSLFIEVSHSKKYVFTNKEVDFEKINQL